ncbi:MAG: NDP-sugar synthase [Phycisphaerae bacterium]|nr:NDP-sugar synthase [Phycisphaerae bacterium]
MPRPLLPVVHQPLIGYALRWLRDGGIRYATVCANSDSRPVRAYLGGGEWLGMRLDYYEDKMPRGPAGCLRDTLNDARSDLVVVVEGSLIPELDLRRVVRTHMGSGAAATVVVAGRGGWGGATPGGAPLGIYVFDGGAVAGVEATGFRDIKESFIPCLCRRDQVVLPFVTEEPCLRVCGPATYLAANEWVLSRITGRPDRLGGYARIGGGLVHETSRVSPDANLVGAVFVGPGTEVRARATVVGPAVIGSGCRIAEDAVVSRSVLWDRSRVDRGGRIDRSIAAHDAEVRAGSRHVGVVLAARRRREPSVLEHLWETAATAMGRHVRHVSSARELPAEVSA